jgi:hypothetical protein
MIVEELSSSINQDTEYNKPEDSERMPIQIELNL